MFKSDETGFNIVRKILLSESGSGQGVLSTSNKMHCVGALISRLMMDWMKLVKASFAGVHIPQPPNPNANEVANVCDRWPGTKAANTCENYDHPEFPDTRGRCRDIPGAL